VVQRDLNTLLGIVFVSALLVILVKCLVDLVYARARSRIGPGRELFAAAYVRSPPAMTDWCCCWPWSPCVSGRLGSFRATRSRSPAAAAMARGECALPLGTDNSGR
jgi:hypothetical protein